MEIECPCGRTMHLGRWCWHGIHCACGRIWRGTLDQIVWQVKQNEKQAA